MPTEFHARRRPALIRLASLIVTGFLLLLSPDGASAVPVFKTLHDFGSRSGDGVFPQSGLFIDSVGTLYGATSNGGKGSWGTVFELPVHNKERILHNFCYGCPEGVWPASNVILDVEGNVYGTTGFAMPEGGGSVFKLSPNADRSKWKLSILYVFCSEANCADGVSPVGGLTYQGAQSGALYDGVSPLYGLTMSGGSSNHGTAYRLTVWRGKRVKETVIYDFAPQNDYSSGYAPNGGLTIDADGNLYGAASLGGTSFSGVAFELSPKRRGYAETVLYNFCADGFNGSGCTDGAYPGGTLVRDARGYLFGTTGGGGAGDQGTVFQIAPDLDETVLYDFCKDGGNCTDGSVPEGVAMNSNGSLFGFTLRGGAYSNGAVFEVTGTSETVLHSFCSPTDCSDGSSPTNETPTLDSSGNLFGTAQSGGAYNGGTVFEVTP